MKKAIRLSGLVALLVLCLPAQEGTQEKIPLLEKKLATATGRAKVDLLGELSALLLAKERDKAGQYAEEARLLAEKLAYPKGTGAACLALARVRLAVEKRGEALVLCRQAKEAYERAGDKLGLMRSLLLAGSIGLEMETYEQSLADLLQSLQAGESLAGVEKERMLIHVKLAILHRRAGNLKETEKQIGLGLALAERTADDRFRGIFYNQQAIDRGDQGDLPGLLAAYEKALAAFILAGDEAGVATAQMNIGSTLLEMDRYEQSLAFLREALAFYRQEKDMSGMIKTLLWTGSAYARMKRPQEARTYFQEGLQTAEKGMPTDRLMAYRMAAQFLFGQGRYKEAYALDEKYIELDGETRSGEIQSRIAELQERYEADKKGREIELLKKDEKIQRLSRNVLFAALVAVLLVLGLILRKYRHLFAFWKRHKYVGQYRITETIGSGGMGVVYKGHSLRDRRTTVAIKVLKDELFQQEAHKKRFKREGTIIDRLDSPHIVKIIERGEDEGRLYLIMEYVAGQTLDRVIAAAGGLEIAACLHMMKQICDALVQIHDKQIVHCDLKPANIMVCEREGDPFFVKLLDFGLSKIAHHSRLTSAGVIMGTFSYMAPESFSEPETAAPADIYALGTVFFEMLTGKAPFQEESLTMLVEKIVEKAPTPPLELRPEIPRALNDLVLEMLAKDPAKRPMAREIKSRLDQF